MDILLRLARIGAPEGPEACVEQLVVFNLFVRGAKRMRTDGNIPFRLTQ